MDSALLTQKGLAHHVREGSTLALTTTLQSERIRYSLATKAMPASVLFPRFQVHAQAL